MRRSALALLVVTGIAPAAADGVPPVASPWSLSRSISDPGPAAPEWPTAPSSGLTDAGGPLARREASETPSGASHSKPTVKLSAERTQAMLRSLTLPGWGQATLGHPTSARLFGMIDLAIWTSFASFRIQEQMRRESYERTAQVLAGIDLSGRNEEFKRIVGSYLSSDQYNQLVVYRDAANLYYDDPPQYWAYIDAHSLRGNDTWAWPDDESLLRYRGQRKDAQRASQRANTALAVAVVNRLVSVLHVARLAPGIPQGSWELMTQPDPSDPTAFRTGIRTRF